MSLQHTELTAGEIFKRTGLTTGAVTGLIDRNPKLTGIVVQSG
ncbi:hypothetical protein ACFOET_18275 [Parapedobacter deserti]|uniref:Uncharacterized protein n=1 Tax=Parapedobacter deserti TaxID=1912957 RepID=A0ABV7JNK0_9SPHI